MNTVDHGFKTWQETAGGTIEPSIRPAKDGTRQQAPVTPAEQATSPAHSICCTDH